MLEPKTRSSKVFLEFSKYEQKRIGEIKRKFGKQLSRLNEGKDRLCQEVEPLASDFVRLFTISFPSKGEEEEENQKEGATLYQD